MPAEITPAPAATPAAPAADAKPAPLRIFDPPAADPAPAPAADPAPAEPAKTEPPPAAAPPAAPPPPAVDYQAELAKAQREKADLEQRLKALEEKAKPTEPARPDAAQVLAGLRAQGVTLEELNKQYLKLDPASVAAAEVKRQIDSFRGEVAQERQQAQAAQVQMLIEQRKGQIAAALETGDAYEQARAAKWDPERVWSEMEREYHRSGQLPGVKAALDKIEADERAKLDAITSTGYAKKKLGEKAAPPPAVAPKPSPTINNGMGAAPARTDKPRTAQQIMDDFFKAGRKLRE